jgi:hypothetical protein
MPIGVSADMFTGVSDFTSLDLGAGGASEIPDHYLRSLIKHSMREWRVANRKTRVTGYDAIAS